MERHLGLFAAKRLVFLRSKSRRTGNAEGTVKYSELVMYEIVPDANEGLKLSDCILTALFT
jgi:hypothetical protein